MNTTPRPRSGVTPINPMRLPARDGPPPATFDPDNAPAGTGKPYPSAWRREPKKVKPPEKAVPPWVSSMQDCPKCGGLCVRREDRVRCLHCGDVRRGE